MKHQIILIGKDITPAYHGIKEFGPDFVHILYTKETKFVPSPMFALIPRSVKYKLYCIEAYQAEGIIATCKEIHRDNTGSFMYNLSEGTKIMAFAAFSVAKEYNAEIIYLTQQGEIVHLDTFEIYPMHTILENHEILALKGSKLSTYTNTRDLSDEDICSSLKIKHFIEEYPKEHERMQKFYESHANRKLNRLPATRTFPNQLKYIQEEGSLFVTLDYKVLLNIPRPNGSTLYFEGRWWETLVAAKVREWSNDQKNVPEVWQSVVFHTVNNSERTKNEVDILLNNEQKLIFIECKSGYVNQNDVYKVDAVRETYGGDVSQAILASYFPVESSLREKTKDLQIALFAPALFTDRTDHLEKLPEWLDRLSDKIQI